MPSFGFILNIVSEKKIFKHFYKIDPFWRPDNQSNTPIWTKAIRNEEDHSINISVKKKFQISPSRQKKIANLHFSHYKSTGTISFHSNQSPYLTGIKSINFRSPFLYYIDALCVIWKESASQLQRRCRLKMLTDDGRTDGRRIPVYTISSP